MAREAIMLRMTAGEKAAIEAAAVAAEETVNRWGVRALVEAAKRGEASPAQAVRELVSKPRLVKGAAIVVGVEGMIAAVRCSRHKRLATNRSALCDSRCEAQWAGAA